MTIGKQYLLDKVEQLYIWTHSGVAACTEPAYYKPDQIPAQRGAWA